MAPDVQPDPATPCPCGCAKCGPNVVKRASAGVGHFVVRLLHDHAVDQGVKKALPVLVFRAVVALGGGVEAAKLAQGFAPAVLRAVGL